MTNRFVMNSVCFFTYYVGSDEMRKEKNRLDVVKRIAIISVIANIFLTLSKIGIGWYGGSNALVADGIHSLADVVASLIVLMVVGFASQPADRDHPYGHGKAEVVISGIVGLLLLLVSLYVVVHAIIGFFHPVEAPNILTFWVALASYVIKEGLYRVSLGISKRHRSKAIEAIAYDHKADIVASLVTALGVLVAIVGMKTEYDFLLYGDIVASIVVAYLIYRIAKEMIVESFHILLERSLDESLIQQYKEVINTFPDVKRIDRIRAREHGHYVLVDIRIAIPYEKNIKQGHDLCRDIKKELMSKFDNIEEVLIHLNPYIQESQG